MGGPSGTIVQSCQDVSDRRHFIIIQIEPNRALISRLVRKQYVFEQLYFSIPPQTFQKVVPIGEPCRFRDGVTYGSMDGQTNMIFLTALHNSP